jgi:hypothetical protein
MKSIEAQASAGPSAPTTPPVSTPPLVSNAKIYVALSTVTNRTSRDGVEVQRAVLDAMRAKLAELGTYQLAPDGESADNAKAVLLRRGLVGYYLAIAVEPFEQTAVGLRVTVRVAVATYPGRDLRAPISTSGTLPGAKAGDVSSENQLLAAVASNGVVLFDRTFHK